MTAQPRLLNTLVDYWHPDAEAFMIEGQLLTPMTTDIYFLTGLSRRGEPINLQTFPLGPFNIEDYIKMYFEVDTEKVGSLVPIHKITSLSLRVILLLIGWIIGSMALHQDSWAHMHCFIQFQEAHIYDCSTTMLTCMKRQLIECREHSNKKFRFGTILCSFFFFESTQYESHKDCTGACGLLPNSMQMGIIASMIRAREDHRGL
jgi:hypothetical protein